MAADKNKDGTMTQLHTRFYFIFFHRLLKSRRRLDSFQIVPSFRKAKKSYLFLVSDKIWFLFKARLEVDAVEGPASHRPVNVLLEETSVRLKRSEKVELVIFGFAKSSSHKNDCF